MNLLNKTSVILAFSAVSALALAVGCSREEDVIESGTDDLTTDGSLQPLVISQVYGGGGNTGAKYTHDFVELFNQSDREVVLAGKGLQYASAAGNFSKTKNYLVLPPSTPKLAPGKYFLIQLAVGGSNGNPPKGGPLSDVDYVATTEIEQLALSATAGKLALVDTTDLDLEGCDAGAPAGEDAGDAGDGGAAPAAAATSCGDPKYIDLVGFGPNANEFRGAAPAPVLSSSLAAIRRFEGCSHKGDNSFDFEAKEPAPRNGKTAAVLDCATRDTSAPPPPPASADAGKDGGAVKKDSGAAKKDAGVEGTGDDDDTEQEPIEGDDDDDSEGSAAPTTKKPKKPSTSTATPTGAPPPQFPATKPEACAAAPGPISSSSGLGVVFGLALVAGAMRRRRR